MAYQINDELLVKKSFHDMQGWIVLAGSTLKVLKIGPHKWYDVHINAKDVVEVSEFDLNSFCEILPKLPKGIDQVDLAQLEMDFDMLPDFIVKTKCECGATSLNSDKHSDYCPLYVRQDV